jgi:hypothetical protein
VYSTRRVEGLTSSSSSLSSSSLWVWVGNDNNFYVVVEGREWIVMGGTIIIDILLGDFQASSNVGRFAWNEAHKAHKSLDKEGRGLGFRVQFGPPFYIFVISRTEGTCLTLIQPCHVVDLFIFHVFSTFSLMWIFFIHNLDVHFSSSQFFHQTYPSSD